jgi:hypothetical protein
MKNEPSERTIDEQQTDFESIAARCIPGASHFRWSPDGFTDDYILEMVVAGKKRSIQVSQSDLDETDDPANIPRLEADLKTSN